MHRCATRFAKSINAGVPPGAAQSALDYARQGYTRLEIEQYDTAWDSEAYITVSGQNSNNSVRLTNGFFDALDRDEDWLLTARTTGDVVKRIKARDLWEQIAVAGMAVRRSRLTVRRHDSRVAYLSQRRPHQCDQPMRHGRYADRHRGWSDAHCASLSARPSSSSAATASRILSTISFRRAPRAVYRLQTAGGYELELTADHQVWTENRGDVPARELRSGDRIALSGSGFGHVSLDERLAFAVGTAVGEGDDIEAAVLTDVTAGINAAKLASPAQVHSAHSSRLKMRSKGAIHGTTGGRPIVEFCSYYASIEEGKAPQGLHRRRLRPRSSRRPPRSFAASIRPMRPSVKIAQAAVSIELPSASSPFLKQVQYMLLSFGVRSELCAESLLRIPAGFLSAFERSIGFHQSSIKTTALALVAGSGCGGLRESERRVPLV